MTAGEKIAELCPRRCRLWSRRDPRQILDVRHNTLHGYGPDLGAVAVSKF